MSVLSEFLKEKGKDLLVSTAKEVIYNSKDIVIEKTTEIIEAKLSQVKDNLEHKIIKNNVSNSSELAIDTKHKFESNIMPVTIDKDSITDIDRIKEYKRILKKRIINNTISSSTEYFLKLERERLQISEDLGEEILDEILKQNTKN